MGRPANQTKPNQTKKIFEFSPLPPLARRVGDDDWRDSNCAPLLILILVFFLGPVSRCAISLIQLCMMMIMHGSALVSKNQGSPGIHCPPMPGLFLYVINCPLRGNEDRAREEKRRVFVLFCRRTHRRWNLQKSPRAWNKKKDGLVVIVKAPETRQHSISRIKQAMCARQAQLFLSSLLTLAARLLACLLCLVSITDTLLTRGRARVCCIAPLTSLSRIDRTCATHSCSLLPSLEG